MHCHAVFWCKIFGTKLFMIKVKILSMNQNWTVEIGYIRVYAMTWIQLTQHRSHGWIIIEGRHKHKLWFSAEQYQNWQHDGSSQPWKLNTISDHLPNKNNRIVNLLLQSFSSGIESASTSENISAVIWYSCYSHYCTHGRSQDFF